MIESLRAELIAVAALLLLAAPGIALLLLALGRLLRGRWLRAGLELGTGTLLLAAAAVLALLGANTLIYQRLTAETEVASIVFRQLGARQFEARLSPAGAAERRFILDGDEWQLDARIVKWRPPATLLGLEPRYRLERLSGRYRDLSRERGAAPRSVYGLGDERWPDLAELVDQAYRFLRWMDAYYGSSAYLPMADGAAFRIHLGPTGLVARPANAPAEQAVMNWN
jgi:hypothetical protein